MTALARRETEIWCFGAQALSDDNRWPLGWLNISAVNPIELSDLDDGDARADGFATAGALRAALDELYPNHRHDGKLWFRVVFEPDSLVPARTCADDRERQLFPEAQS